MSPSALCAESDIDLDQGAAVFVRPSKSCDRENTAETSAMTTKILCATDGSEHSKTAVVYAAGLSSKTQVPLTVCSVNVAMGGMRAPVVYLRDSAEIKSILEDAAKLALENGAKKVDKVELKSREASSAIVQYAEENGYDHIVTGTGNKHGMSRLILGSVASDIAGRAHCTVTVAR